MPLTGDTHKLILCYNSCALAVPTTDQDRMPRPDFDAARRYVLDRLARELSPALLYHSLQHTRDDVVPAAQRLAAMEGITGEARLLLLTAAHYHDLGFVEQRDDHELASLRLVEAALPGFGYSPQQVRAVGDLVMATRLPQSPGTRLAELLADADLDVLGRADFWKRSLDLRAEWDAFGQHYSDPEWVQRQLEFVCAHRYFSSSARRLRDATKQANIAHLASLLAHFEPGATPAPRQCGA